MKVKIFTRRNSDVLEEEVNKYLESLPEDCVWSIQMTESENCNSVMVVTK